MLPFDVKPASNQLARDDPDDPMRGILAILAMICLLLSAEAARADKRIALVIGNGAYQHIPALTEPANDARAIAEILRVIGFVVVEGTDLTRSAMTDRVREFAEKAVDADIALVFYSGQTIAVTGTNYLLPVDADVHSEMDVKLGAAMNAGLALGESMRDAKVKITFLDASRGHPFDQRNFGSPTRAVSVSYSFAEMTFGNDSLTVLSATPGKMAPVDQPGTHSAFTRALLKNLAIADLEIQQTVSRVTAQVYQETNKQQLPWTNTSLLKPLYLNPGKNAVQAELEATKAELARLRLSVENERSKTTAQKSNGPQQQRDVSQSSTTLPSIPDFPWPPPSASASYVLPDQLFRDHLTLGQATDAITAALEKTGYVERTFFRTQPGGIALVTRLERIEPDGTPVEPERWAIGEKSYVSTDNLAKFLRGLFFVDQGHYRLIVFILQDTPFVQSTQKMTEADARGLLNRGANILPDEIGQKLLKGNHCTALVYEYASDGKAVKLVESRLTGKQHLSKAGLLSLLDQSN